MVHAKKKKSFVEEKSFSTKLFIISSLGILVMFIVMILFINGVFFGYSEPLVNNDNFVSDKYFLNDSFKQGDPLITSRPSLRDALRGPIISVNDPGKGSIDAKVNIVYFSDFECSFCKKQEELLSGLLEKYENNIRIIWKDYPVSDYKSQSFQASLAARCANDENKFWEYHDELFEATDNLDMDFFIEVAKKVDLNIEDFAYCMKTRKHENQIVENILEANALDITGVPFTYINDQEIMGEITEKELDRIIEIEMSD